MILASSKAAQSTSAATAPRNDWREQFRQSFTDPAELLLALELQDLTSQLSADVRRFPMRVPRAYVARMRLGDRTDPLLRQVLPLSAEDQITPGYRLDAVGDHMARTAQGVLQKYHGRALLIATGSCAINCRYCFRRHYPYSEDTAATAGWQQAVRRIAEDASITEVILSGGDPLVLSTHKLRELGDALASIPHVRRLRIHTRLPVVLPARVDAELCDWVRSVNQRVIIVVHVNHAQEIDNDVSVACQCLRSAGASLLNQAVLLKGINDDPDTLIALSERLMDIGVLPYYLHQLDQVQGAAHFAVDDARARSLMTLLRRQLPGYLVPRLVREIEGEPSKTPLTDGQLT